MALPSPAASNTVVINARCSLRIEAGQRVIIVAGLPVHHYCAEDAVAEAYAMVFLVESGFAQQTDVARAFARSVRTVRRYQRRYAQGGMVALDREEGWRRGRRRISGKRLRSIEMLKSQGMSNRAIAHRLGVSEKAIRKLVGPSKPADSAQLAFVGITTAAAGKSPASRVPSATLTGDDADRATSSAEDRAGDRDPITAPAEDGEPVPMSLDRDASDRTFDRQLAYLGLLDDAAPLFREGCSVPGVGVLLALPCLLESGLLRISRKLYGEIGPAFYGLRTTLLTLLFMALLRIKRPEHLKERDPAAFGSLLGLADANETRDWRIYAEFAHRLIAQARKLYAEESLGIELSNTVYALDSTTIDLCLSLFPWAHFRSTKAAVKMHTLLDLRGNIPSFIHISDGKAHDVHALDLLLPEAGAIYVMDRGYIDFARLYVLHQAGAFFVTRAKSN